MANLGYIQLVRICNQKCRFCSNPDTDATLSIEDARTQIDDFASRGYDGIILTGGEPTLCPHLEEVVKYAFSQGIEPRMITNGQKTADRALVQMLAGAGLKQVHISVHSHDEQLQAELTGNPDSLANIRKSLDLFKEFDIRVDVNITIQAFNADQLDKTVIWLCKNWPHLSHFVFNTLDPTSDRVAENPDTIPKLTDLELSLNRALALLHQSGRTFRVERLPLCYMADFAWASTETRKIVKGEERIVYFLDYKGMVRQTDFEHGKADVCKVCSLNDICAGLFAMDSHYSSGELYPLFVPKEPIVAKILSDED